MSEKITELVEKIKVYPHRGNGIKEALEDEFGVSAAAPVVAAGAAPVVAAPVEEKPNLM